MSDFDKAAKSASETDKFAACKWRFIDALLRDARLKPRDKVVGVRLVQRHIHHADSIAYPGKDLLAEDLGMRARTVGRALSWLVHCGWFVQGRAAGGRGLANEYAVDWSKHRKSKTLSDLAPFQNRGAETMTNEAVKGANGGTKRVSDLAPQKRKTKRDIKESRGAASDSAMGPSVTASRNKGAQQGNGVSHPMPRPKLQQPAKPSTSPACKINDKLVGDYRMGPIEARNLVLGVGVSKLGGIASRLDSLKRSELLGELKAAAT